MIRVKLKDAIETYWLRTGKKLTYAELAEMSGVAEDTLSSISSRFRYQPNLTTVEKICRALDYPLHDLLEMIDDPPEPEPDPKTAKKRSKTTKKKKKATKKKK